VWDVKKRPMDHQFKVGGDNIKIKKDNPPQGCIKCGQEYLKGFQKAFKNPTLAFPALSAEADS
jgi:hypothetical protein